MAALEVLKDYRCRRILEKLKTGPYLEDLKKRQTMIVAQSARQSKLLPNSMQMLPMLNTDVFVERSSALPSPLGLNFIKRPRSGSSERIRIRLPSLKLERMAIPRGNTRTVAPSSPQSKSSATIVTARQRPNSTELAERRRNHLSLIPLYP